MDSSELLAHQRSKALMCCWSENQVSDFQGQCILD